jgi:uroporphyrinogen-III decarboxylase
MPIMDYFTDSRLWFEANLKAVERFGDIMFLPGFWSEFGMCTEPSAFGCKCIWPENEFPTAAKLIIDTSQIDYVKKPNPRTDGLCPFVIKRLKQFQKEIEAKGHTIKFAVSRGPLNLASFLMGTTEFLVTCKTETEKVHKLLNTITDFIVDWIQTQAETFTSIDGVLILDDIVGFLGEEDFKKFALIYLKRIFDALNAKVKFFHNDAEGLVCTPFLPQIGVNLFNFSFKHSISELKELSGNKVTMMGNIPPRDVLANGTVEDVRQNVKDVIDSLEDKSRVILSCGGGMPPGVPTENIEVFYSAVKSIA